MSNPRWARDKVSPDIDVQHRINGIYGVTIKLVAKLDGDNDGTRFNDLIIPAFVSASDGNSPRLINFDAVDVDEVDDGRVEDCEKRRRLRQR